MDLLDRPIHHVHNRPAKLPPSYPFEEHTLYTNVTRRQAHLFGYHSLSALKAGTNK